MWTVRHLWPAGERFAFNFYNYWAQLLLCHMWSLPVTLLIQWGVTQGEPLLMLLYRITLVPMSEDLRKVDPGLLAPFYADDASFDGLV